MQALWKSSPLLFSLLIKSIGEEIRLSGDRVDAAIGRHLNSFKKSFKITMYVCFLIHSR